MPPTTLGMLEVWKFGLPGSTRSGEKQRKKSLPTSRPVGRVSGGEFVCRARIGGGFEHHQETGMEVTGNGFGRGDDEAHVGIFGFAEGRGNADIDGIESADDGKIGGGAELAGFYERREGFVWHIFYVGMAGVELIDFGLLDVDADDFETGFGEFDGEGKTDVTETEDTNFGGFVANFALQLSGYGGRRRSDFLNHAWYACVGDEISITVEIRLRTVEERNH